ncbi:NUDIX domain-containing protein [Thalassospira povalilytica]|uniref:ADP-ribose pyrophosphatase n=1 Tax=Thalassospira povalilytica TaxID=732237 RepID=A0A8I1M8G5_9PROT|nr:NUDIX domain-containing protein [Thalassospira povalilytica]MBN8197043.1 NUDIX domain-containing protein [Thalassospira povalilytica]
MTEQKHARPRQFHILDQKRGWDGYFKLDVYRLQHDKFDGGKSAILEREVLERGHAVALLPYDPVRDEVVLIEQFRPGTLSVQNHYRDMPVWLTEIVAGIIEDGESAEDVARRETIEEAGCEIIGPLELISRYYVTPGCSSETVTMYYGRVDTSNAGGIHGLAEEGEDIRVFTVSADECFAMLQNGQLCNATATIALQWLMLHRDRIRREAGV